MGFLKNIVAIPASLLYGVGVAVHNTMFDWGIKKATEFDIPVICVGNITVGGTGKTPMTEYLVQLLSSYYNVAVLSRGYKRKTKGFVLALPDMSFKRIGDEPKQIKLKFPTIPVAVCEKRVEGIRRLREAHPEINLIILDDAFQHRYVESWVNIVLMDYNNPVYEDRLLPWGRLRDFRSSLDRAHMVVVTKCPVGISPLDCRIVRNNLGLYAYQSLFFTKLSSRRAIPLFPELSGDNPLPYRHPVIAIATVANPTLFVEHLEDNYTLVDKLIFSDHHTYRMRDIARLEEILERAPEGTVVVMTEKDAVKLMNSHKIAELTRAKMFYISIAIDFIDDQDSAFIRIISHYVSENYKYKITHPE